MMEERFGPIGSERYRSYLRDIHLSGEHLMSLINDLLDLSKVEAGKLDLNFEAVSLNDVIRECVALMQPQANRERIIIRSSLSSMVPSVVADLRSLRQIPQPPLQRDRHPPGGRDRRHRARGPARSWSASATPASA
jgi:signal transduction histidine kinase